MFLYRINHPDNKVNETPLPFRGYVIDYGFDAAYKSEIGNATKLLQRVMRRSGPAWTAEGMDFMLAVFWGDPEGHMGGPAQVMDLYGYSLNWEFASLDDGPGNPDVKPYVLKNGVWQCSRPTFCEDSFIMLGREGEHRRRSDCLVDAMRTWPNLGDIEPSETVELS
jgi:hypothetical protein